MADSGGSQDGTGASDHDLAYYFGNPRARLGEHDLMRLLVLRGHVQDARAGYPEMVADDLEPALWSSRAPPE
jgi:hypothetical protein